MTQQLGFEQGAALIEAGKEAFSSTHSVLLSTASGLIGALAILVFFMLASYREKGTAHH